MHHFFSFIQIVIEPNFHLFFTNQILLWSTFWEWQLRCIFCVVCLFIQGLKMAYTYCWDIFSITASDIPHFMRFHSYFDIKSNLKSCIRSTSWNVYSLFWKRWVMMHIWKLSAFTFVNKKNDIFLTFDTIDEKIIKRFMIEIIRLCDNSLWIISCPH